jgi:hypothetical protein
MREMCFPVLVDCKAVNQSKSPRVSHTRGLGRRQEGLGAECCCRPRRQRGSASSGSELPPPILLGLTLHGWRFRVLTASVCYLRSRVRLFRSGRFVRVQFSCAFLEASAICRNCTEPGLFHDSPVAMRRHTAACSRKYFDVGDISDPLSGPINQH